MLFITFPFRRKEAQNDEDDEEGWSRGLRLRCKHKGRKVFWGRIVECFEGPAVARVSSIKGPK